MSIPPAAEGAAEGDGTGQRQVEGLQFLLPAEDVGGLALHDDLPAVHHDRPIGEHRLFGKVGDEENGDPPFFIQPLHDVRDLFPAPRVEHGGGFVQNHDFGQQRQDARDGDALFLPAREPGGRRIPVCGHAHGVEGKIDALSDLFAGHPDVFGTEGDVVFDDGRHRLIVGVLKDDADVFADVEELFGIPRVHAEHGDLPRRRGQKPVGQARQRGFAAPVVPQNGDEFPFLHGKADAAQSEGALFVLSFVI